MKKDYKEHVDFIDNGYCLNRRTIFLDKIDDSEMQEAIRIIMAMESISSEPITLYISTYGGTVMDGLSLYDFLRESPCRIETIANGKVMSMGIILFLAGDDREIKEHTRFMMHSVGSATGGRLEDMDNDLKETKALNDILKNIIQDRTKLSMKEVNRLTGKLDYFFNKEQAIERGFTNDEAHK